MTWKEFCLLASLIVGGVFVVALTILIAATPFLAMWAIIMACLRYLFGG
jgi:hypothetical protein